MKSFNFKKLVGISALSVVAILGTSEISNAQTWRQDQRQDKKISKQQDRINRQNAKIARQRQLIRQQQIRNSRNNTVYSNGNNRYRVYRNGAYYNTDNRGAELLRQAVNSGYQQGYNAGQNDRNYRGNRSWNNNNVYRSGTYGYQSYVDRNQYQYYFQQGFQRGYQDGQNSRYQYGSNNGGTLNILGTILNQVLNLQQY